MTLADDVDSIKRFKNGDPSTFEEIVRRHQDRIYNLCRYMLQDTQDAQDAAQDVFVKAYAGLKAFKPDASLSTWLYRIAVNTCLDHKKKSRLEPLDSESLIEDLASAEPSPERLYESKEISRAVQGALQKLPENLRAAIVLKEIEELSYEEIAAVLDTALGTVKSRISRAREELRRLLRKKV
jgi:RNA polymerase sigma-70 factor (ECF subfamily)